jgi:DNA-binding NarL/FixJ family response regulator
MNVIAPLVFIASDSALVRRGIRSFLEEVSRFEIREFDDLRRLSRMLQSSDPALILLTSSLFSEQYSWKSYCGENPEMIEKTILIVYHHRELIQLHTKIETVFLSDPKEELTRKINLRMETAYHKSEKEETSELSTREKSILREIALGRTSKEIADRLFISAHTVITHRKNINRKLGIKTVSGLTVYAILNKIVSPAELEGTL